MMVAAPAPAPPRRFDQKAIAVEVRPNGTVVYDANGATIEKRGSATSRGRGPRRLSGALRAFLLPSAYPATVSSDYAPVRRWVAVQHFASAGVDFFATQGILAGLGVHLSSPLVGTISYVGKDGLNGVGQMVGGALAKKADVDPKTWYARCEYISSAASALQSTLILAPHLFLVTAPLTNGAKAFASAVSGAATANIDNHQSLGQSVGEMKAKNNNQNMVSGAVGSALAVGLSVAGHPFFGRWTNVALATGFMGLQMFAAHRAASALKMDDVTQAGLRKVVHQLVQNADVPSPRDKISIPRAQPDPQLGAGLERFVADPTRFQTIRAIHASDRYLLDFDGKKVRVAFDTEATPEDQARSVFEAQLLAELVTSPSWKKTSAGLSERDAQIKAVEIARSATPASVTPLLDEMHDAGWTTSRIVLGADNVRVQWQPANGAPPSPISMDDFRALLK